MRRASAPIAERWLLRWRIDVARAVFALAGDAIAVARDEAVPGVGDGTHGPQAIDAREEAERAAADLDRAEDRGRAAEHASVGVDELDLAHDALLRHHREPFADAGRIRRLHVDAPPAELPQPRRLRGAETAGAVVEQRGRHSATRCLPECR